MGLKKVVALSMALVLLVVAVSTSVSAARADPVLDIFELLSAQNKDYSKSSVVRAVRGKGDNAGACCDSCVCTKSIPPQCSCLDNFKANKCLESGCDLCICLLIWPPVCRCMDVTTSCKPPCSSSATTSITYENEAANILKSNYVGSN